MRTLEYLIISCVREEWELLYTSSEAMWHLEEFSRAHRKFSSFLTLPLQEVNNWLPRVTMAVPSPMTVVKFISVSKIRSSSVATSRILGRLLELEVMQWRVKLIRSLIPSDVKLEFNLGSISSLEFRRDSTYQMQITKEIFILKMLATKAGII